MGADTMTGDDITGFDLYEHYRSQVFQTVLLVAPSWDSLEMYERVAWDGLAKHVGSLVYAAVADH